MDKYLEANIYIPGEYLGVAPNINCARIINEDIAALGRCSPSLEGLK